MCIHYLGNSIIILIINKNGVKNYKILIFILIHLQLQLPYDIYESCKLLIILLIVII
jgi:hypothetical protein